MFTEFLTAGLLCTLLGSPHFGTRQAAHEALLALGDKATPVLELYAGSADPEVRWRIGRLLDARRPALVDALAARHPTLRIDALLWNYPDRNGAIGRLLADTDWPECPTDPQDGAAWREFAQVPYRLAVRTLIVLLLYNDHSYAEVAGLLDQMAARQAAHYDAIDNCWRDDD